MNQTDLRVNKFGRQLNDIATNITFYGIKGDGTDTSTQMQSAIDAIIQISKKIIFPYKASFDITGLLTIPDGVEIDFNKSTITTTNSIILSGSNITLKNLTLNEKTPIVGNLNGIYCSDGVPHDNIILDNVSTYGFWKGIVIGNETNQSKNLILNNCKTNNATSWGCQISNILHGSITNHQAYFNKTDGFKFGFNSEDIIINGGVFSDNGYNGEYADGIDLYSGGQKVKIIGATCERNPGCGIHIGSGDGNDPNLHSPTNGIIENIIIEACRLAGNGMGLDLQVIVNDTYPYPGFTTINNCVISDNIGEGIVFRARNASVNNCIIRNNGAEGIRVSKSKNVTLSNNIITSCTKQGILIEYSKNVLVNGGLIDGLTPTYERIGDVVSGTPSHGCGIAINLDANTDNISLLYPEIKNYSGTNQIDISNKSSYPNAKIVYHLHDIGTDSLANYYASYGSTAIKNNRLYKKNTNVNSNAWELDRIIASGQISLAGDGTKTSFTIPHGLSGTPLSFSISPRNSTVANYNYALQVDGTNILVYFANALPSGSFAFNWKAEY